jgi:hypothetical protein
VQPFTVFFPFREKEPADATHLTMRTFTVFFHLENKNMLTQTTAHAQPFTVFFPFREQEGADATQHMCNLSQYFIPFGEQERAYATHLRMHNFLQYFFHLRTRTR